MRLVAWTTRLTGMDTALMTNLGWGDALVIAVDYHRTGQKRRSLKIVFDKGPAFRTVAIDIAREYWTRHGVDWDAGRTFIAEESAWVAELAASGRSLAASTGGPVRHYVIMTDEYAVEVLAGHSPDIIDA